MESKEILDFSIYSDKNRELYIEEKLASMSRVPTAKELELFSNFILYGKDENTGLSVVDEKLVEIPTKYKSYAKKKDKTVSLEGLQESPTFDERTVHPLQKTIYKKPKQNITNITSEEMESLRADIKKLAYRYDVAIGKKEDTTLSPLTATQIYHLKHQLISLRSQQYILKDSIAPTLTIYPTPSYHDVEEDFIVTILPLGAKLEGEAGKFFGNMKNSDGPPQDLYSSLSPLDYKDNNVINFCDPVHVHRIIEAYEALSESALRDKLSDAAYIIATLNWYIDKACLAKSRREITLFKKSKWTNRDIRAYINAKYGTSYSENYISTIYTKEICRKIAEAAILHYDEYCARLNEAAWKKCTRCGTWKLKDTREYNKRSSAIDGYSSICRECRDSAKGKEKER